LHRVPKTKREEITDLRLPHHLLQLLLYTHSAAATTQYRNFALPRVRRGGKVFTEVGKKVGELNEVLVLSEKKKEGRKEERIG
jgi:hypothetical protein